MTNDGGEKKYKVVFRRATSPSYLEVQTNASETGFKTIKSGRGSEREAVESPRPETVILHSSSVSTVRAVVSPGTVTAIPQEPEAVTAIVHSPTPKTATRAQTARTIVVMRHGERLDDLFGRWFEDCKTKNGSYRQKDLNMPPDLGTLNRPLSEYECDTALTVLGQVLAQKVGRAMLVSGRRPDVVYCSPAFRCIQTAAVAASMSRRPFKLRIEPGLFENVDLYPGRKPNFVKVEDLKAAGFDIDEDYTPYFKLEDLFTVPETNESYNDRVQSSLQYITEQAALGRGTVLVAAHASTVDLAYGVFHPRFSKEPRVTTATNLIKISEPVPYTANTTFMRASDDSPWQYIREAIPPITYRNFSSRLNHDFIERGYPS